MSPSQPQTFAFIFPMASGHINPSLPVARSLVALGHRVHYLCREQMRGAIEDTGAVFHSDVEVETELYEGRAPDVFGALDAMRKEFGLGAEAVTPLEAMLKLRNPQLELMLPGVLRWLRRLDAAAVMYCPLMNVEAALAAQVVGIPSVALLTTAGPGSCPRAVEEFFAMCGISLAQAQEMSTTFGPKLEATRRMNSRYGLGLTDLEGFEPFGMLDVLARSSATLVTTSEDLQDPMPAELAEVYARLGVRFEYVGPLLDAEGSQRAAGHKYSGAGDVAEHAAGHGSRESCDEVVARVREAKARGRSVVVASMGTVITGDSPEFGWEGRLADADGRKRGLTGRELCRAAWGAAFDAFGAKDGEAGPLIVVALGPQEEALGELRPPANAVCLRAIPQVDVLKAGVDLFLTHGGQNSFTEGLAHGVPLVVCPGFGDQAVNARKAEALGVGLQVARPMPEEEDVAAATAAYREEVAAALRRTHAEPGFREAARAATQRLASPGGVSRAVEVTLEVAAQKSVDVKLVVPSAAPAVLSVGFAGA